MRRVISQKWFLLTGVFWLATEQLGRRQAKSDIANCRCKHAAHTQGSERGSKASTLRWGCKGFWSEITQMGHYEATSGFLTLLTSGLSGEINIRSMWACHIPTYRKRPPLSEYQIRFYLSSAAKKWGTPKAICMISLGITSQPSLLRTLSDCKKKLVLGCVITSNLVR